jgi:hypothetical protein
MDIPTVDTATALMVTAAAGSSGRFMMPMVISEAIALSLFVNLPEAFLLMGANCPAF